MVHRLIGPERPTTPASVKANRVLRTWPIGVMILGVISVWSVFQEPGHSGAEQAMSIALLVAATAASVATFVPKAEPWIMLQLGPVMAGHAVLRAVWVWDQAERTIQSKVYASSILFVMTMWCCILIAFTVATWEHWHLAKEQHR